MTPYNFSVLLFSFCTFFVGLLIFLRRQDSLGKFYFAFSIAVTIWGTVTAIMISPEISYSTALLASRISNIAAVFIPILWVHFVAIYTKVKFPNFIKMGLYAIAVAIISFSFSPLFIKDVRPILDFKAYTVPGPVFYIFTAYFWILTPAAFILLLKGLKKVTHQERIQRLGLAMGTFFGFSGGGLTFLPVYGIQMPQYGLFIIPFYPFILGYFMMREQLFDVQQIADAFQREKLTALGVMAASLNHELKNPLFISLGRVDAYQDALERGAYPSEVESLRKAQDVIATVKTQLSRATDIMQRFLDFVRPVNPKRDREEVKLNEIVDSVLELISYEFQLDKIQVVKEIQSELSLLIHKRQFEEILFNLIMNACQAIKSGMINSRSKAFIKIASKEENNIILLAITDNGPGMSKEQIGKVFEPFFTTKKEGIGLGLYITKQLIERNGGKISVHSKTDDGTTFLLEFKR